MKKIDWLGIFIVLLFVYIGVLSVMLVALFVEAMNS